MLSVVEFRRTKRRNERFETTYNITYLSIAILIVLKLTSHQLVFVAFVEDNATKSLIPYFVNHVSYFVQY